MLAATWVKRLPSEEEGFLKDDESAATLLSPVQREKLSQCFAHLLDSDRDDIITRQDFENLSEVSWHMARLASRYGAGQVKSSMVFQNVTLLLLCYFLYIYIL